MRGALVILSVASIPAAARATPITFQAPLPLEPGELGVATAGSWAQAPDGPAPEEADERVLTASLTAMVGLPRLTLAAGLPVIDRSAVMLAPDGDQVERGAQGPGDLTTTAVISVLPARALPDGVRAAPFVGVKIPTGSSDRSDSLGRLPQRLQVGTGGWDALAGLLVSWQPAAAELDASLGYLVRGAAHDFDAGDETRGELSARRSLAPWGAGAGLANRLLGAIESRVVWQAADRGPLAPAVSGGFSWYVCPGLQAVLGRHTVEAALELPLVQPIDHHTDLVARVGYRVMFAR